LQSRTFKIIKDREERKSNSHREKEREKERKREREKDRKKERKKERKREREREGDARFDDEVDRSTSAKILREKEKDRATPSILSLARPVSLLSLSLSLTFFPTLSLLSSLLFGLLLLSVDLFLYCDASWSRRSPRRTRP